MIDRDKKIVLNGFGTVGVGGKYGALILEYIQPPKEIGSNILYCDDIINLDTLEIKLNRNEINQFEKDLNCINKDNTIFILKGWEINFDEYNEKSVDVYKCVIKIIRGFNLLALAC